MHAMKGPEELKGFKRKGKKSHQDSEIKKDTLEKRAHWMVSKRLEELQKSHGRKVEEQHGKTPKQTLGQRSQIWALKCFQKDQRLRL